MSKAIYIPTNENTFVLNKNDTHCEILLHGDYKTVPIGDIKFADQGTKLSTLQEFKDNVFVSLVQKPVDGIFYSHNANRFTPEPHQYKPLLKILNSETNRILIADEVGLGKTIEAGMIYQEISKRERIGISLIVVPTSLTLKWRHELMLRFNEKFEIQKVKEFIYFINEYDKYYDSKLYDSKLIISYHTLRNEKVFKALKKSIINFDFLIMDEAHSMRNGGGNTFLAGQIITEISKNIILLSATPVQNKLEDLFNILSLLDNQYFKDYDFFEQKIAPNRIIHRLISDLRNNKSLLEIHGYIKEVIESGVDNELQEICNNLLNLKILDTEKRVEYIKKLTEQDYLSFIINRTKKRDVGRVIPRRASSAVIDLTAVEQQYYDSVKDFIKFIHSSMPTGFITIIPERMASSSMIASLEGFKDMRARKRLLLSQQIDDLDEEDNELGFTEEALNKLDNVIQIGEQLGGYDSKFKGFEEILTKISSNGIKQVIVFSFFKKTIEYLNSKLQGLGYRVNKIHGGNTVEDRYGIIEKFKAGDFDILLSSEVGSEGLDMQFCNVVVNYDLPWNPMRVEQRIGRIDRIGQKFEVLHIYNLCIKGSIEDRIFNRLYQKLNIFEESIGELEPILGDLVEKLDLSNLVDLTDEELESKLKLEELALKRSEIDTVEHKSQLEQLLNDDINNAETIDHVLNQQKIALLEQQCELIVTQFLEENNINYARQKDNSLKINNENMLKQLAHSLNLLKSQDKRDLSNSEENKLQKELRQLKELTITFGSQDSSFNSRNITIMHPVIRMILRKSNINKLYSTCTHPDYDNKYAIVYRAEFNANKRKSFIKVIITDKDYNYHDEVDYFDFIIKCSDANQDTEQELFLGKDIAKQVIAQQVATVAQNERVKLNRLIDLRIQSISKYYQKKIDNALKQKRAVTNERVQQMRDGEIDNLQKELSTKIDELNNQRNIQESFEILGTIEVN